jgi:hypothetical protein
MEGGSHSQGAALLALQSSSEVLQTLHVSGPRLKLGQATVEELADKVEATQARVTGLESSLARNNPAVFVAAQASHPLALDR